MATQIEGILSADKILLPNAPLKPPLNPTRSKHGWPRKSISSRSAAVLVVNGFTRRAFAAAYMYVQTECVEVVGFLRPAIRLGGIQSVCGCAGPAAKEGLRITR